MNKSIEILKRELEDISQELFVPKELLEKILLNEEIETLIKKSNGPKQNYYSSKNRNPLSLRYLNEAFAWYNLLDRINFHGSDVVELCHGTSCIMDLALSYAAFEGTLTRIDYRQWNQTIPIIRKKFQSINLKFDILQHPERIPLSPLIVLNHAIDDLFIGLWSDDQGIDYFSYKHPAEKEKEYWDKAINEQEKYISTLITFFDTIPDKVISNGHLIIRNYPSSYEIHHNMEARIIFTQQLTEKICKQLSEQLHQRGVTLPLINQLDLENTFYILQKTEQQ